MLAKIGISFTVSLVVAIAVMAYEQSVSVGNGLHVYLDKQTGCQYVGAGVIGAWSPLTPRLGSNGLPICHPEKDLVMKTSL